MARPITLCTGQWADMPFGELCGKAKTWGYDGLELGCWGDLFDVHAALHESGYCRRKWDQISDAGLHCLSISNHLAGQAVCDLIDERHKAILPPRLWGDGDPEGVRRRAAAEMMDTARAARRFFDAAPAATRHALKRVVVNGFTGSSIWHLLYSFPPVLPGQIDAGYRDFAERWLPILEVFDRENVDFALEVHPTEIAFDISSTVRALDAIGHHRRFGFNFDPSHLGYQHVDYVRFLRQFRERIFHVHMKDVHWSAVPTACGVFGGHLPFGHPDRYWDFRSLGHGCIDFKAVIRALNEIGYDGPLSVEWEDSGMNREQGAAQSALFVRNLDFAPSNQAFDAAFARD
jgi:sugar phosphate isomerase/epimerase